MKLSLLDTVVRFNGPLYFLAGVISAAVAFTLSLALGGLVAFAFIATAMGVAEAHDRRKFWAEVKAERVQTIGRHRLAA